MSIKEIVIEALGVLAVGLVVLFGALLLAII